jgi:hypothetical protein
MIRRLWMPAVLLLLLACQFVLLADQSPSGTESPVRAPIPQAESTIPETIKTDYAFFFHANVKAIRESSLVVEVKQTLAKEGLEKIWDDLESKPTRELGFKLADLDSITVCVTEVPPRGEPKFVAILTSSKPFDKNKTFQLDGEKVRPDVDGFYKRREIWTHFPDDKTAVALHPDLAKKYLNGYANDRKTWPFTAELTKATAKHTLLATANVQKLLLDQLPEDLTKTFKPLLKTQDITLTANLRGKELLVAARATFPNADAAGQAKEMIQKFVVLAAEEIDKYTNFAKKHPGEFFSPAVLQPILNEAHRAVKEAKVETTGSDVTFASSYRANFDLAKLVPVLVKQIHESIARVQVFNNFKQCMLAMHNYHSAYDKLPIHGTGAKGGPLKANEKPLLSWRVAILPYIEEDELYKQFKLDEPWDSENNKKLIEKMPKIYAPVVRPDGKPGKAGYTHVQMVIGPKAMPAASIGFASFTDGTSNTIGVVEAAEPVIWTKPDDVMFPEKELPKGFRKKFGGQFPGFFIVGLWDGSVRVVSDSVSDKTLGSALSPSGGEVLGDDW